MNIHLVTPGFRPEFIKRQLKYLCEFRDIGFTWHIIMDSKIELDLKNDSNFNILQEKINLLSVDTQYNFGFEQRSHFTKTLSKNYPDSDWLYFLDDDNLPSYDVFECWKKYRLDDNVNFVLLSQLRFYNPNKKLYGRKGCDSLGNVDIGNFICKLKIIQGLEMNPQLYNYDGHLVEHLKRNFGDSFAYEESLVSFYNILHV